MSAANPTHEPSARSPFAGCTILIVCVLVLVFLVGFSTWVLFRQADEIAKFTSETAVPVPVESLENREAELNTLSERLEGFRQSLDREEETTLELTKGDLNLAIAAFASLSELKNTFHVREIREDGRVVLDVSLKFNGKPRLARENEPGVMASDPRYLNGTLIVRPELAEGEIVLRIDTIDIPGATVPEPFRQQMSPYRVTERYKQDPVLGPAMMHLTSLTVTEGKVILRKKPGERAPGTITDDEVNAGVSRLFKGLGMVACGFLALVGLMLYAGLRAKRRKEDPPGSAE